MTPEVKRSSSSHRLLFAVCSLTLVILTQAACGGGARAVKETVSGDWIRVYFTSPRYPDDDAYHRGGLDEELAAVIGQAETSVDVAAYDFDLQTVADALIAAHQREVQVRFITDSDNADEEAVADLERAGIPIVEDERDGGLMHNKFAVIDQVWVWTGSWNLTDNGTYRNNNNAVLIASPALAENYTAEFEEMFDGQFGPTSPADTPNPHVIITAEVGTSASDEGQTKQIEVENYFAPEDEVAAQIIAEIESARSRIRFMAFVFTSDEIAGAILERAQAGVTVQGMIEDRSPTFWSANSEPDHTAPGRRRRVPVHNSIPPCRHPDL